jgi:hypothetical protein
MAATLTLTETDLPSEATVMDVLPGPSAVTRPLLLTVTTLSLFDVNVTVLGRGLPPALRGVAVIVAVSPTVRLRLVGLTSMLATDSTSLGASPPPHAQIETTIR